MTERHAFESARTRISVASGALMIAGCAAPSPVVHDGLRGGVLQPRDLPVAVRQIGNEIDVQNSQHTLEARFITFQQRGNQARYGIYGAHSDKHHMRVPAPLRGNPIAWPNRDHAQALAYLLELTGIQPHRARALVARHASVWFRDGLRVFVATPDALWIYDLEP